MEIKEMIKILQAFENGEEIECLSMNKLIPNWRNFDSLNFNFTSYTYRIKPKQEYIPFDYNDDLVGKVVRSNKPNKVVNHPKLLIIKQCYENVLVGDYLFISYQELLESYIFLDGSKCGKLKS